MCLSNWKRSDAGGSYTISYIWTSDLRIVRIEEENMYICIYYIDWSTFILFFPKWTSYETDKSKYDTNIFLFENRSRHHNMELKYINQQTEEYDLHYKPVSVSYIHVGSRNGRRKQWQTLSHKVV